MSSARKIATPRLPLLFPQCYKLDSPAYMWIIVKQEGSLRGGISKVCENFWAVPVPASGVWMRRGLEPGPSAGGLADRRRQSAADSLAAERNDAHDGQCQGHEAAVEAQAR